MDPEGKFVRAFDADTPGDRIADALRELMARPREGGTMVITGERRRCEEYLWIV
jgi:hypothetical protein